MQTDKTILEVAQELGVSKNSVKYHASKLSPVDCYKDESGKIMLTPAAVDLLRAKLSNHPQPVEQPLTTTPQPPTTTEEPPNNQFTTDCTTTSTGCTTTPSTTDNQLYSALLMTVETLQEQLATKDKQLEAAEREKAELMEMLKEAQQTVKQAQALHAGTIQTALIESKPSPDQGEDAPPAPAPADSEGQEKKHGFWDFLKRRK